MVNDKLLMDNWKNRPLSRVFRLTNGKSISADYIDKKNDEYCIPVFGGNSILGYARKYLIDDNTLVIGRVGEYCGNVNIVNGKVWVSDNALYISKWLIKCDINFLYYLLNYIDLNKYSDATGQPKITQSLLRRIKPLFPENPKEQTAIATILSKVDEAIEATRQSIKAAEKLKKALMQNLLTGKLKPDGTWRTDDEFYEDEKFGKVPVGWIIIKGNKITNKIAKGQSPKWQGFEYQDEGILFVTSENVRDGYIEIDTPKYLPIEFHNKIKNSQLKKEDILINIVGASIGRCAVFNLDVKYANTNQAVCVFRPNAENDCNFLAYYLQAGYTQRRLLGTQVETARANLSLGDFRKFKFIIPETKDEQILISEKLNEVTFTIQFKQTKIQTLQRLKKSLMQNLLTGKVRVDVEAINKIISEQNNGR